MILIQNEFLLVEYEEPLDFLYHERRGPISSDQYRHDIIQVMDLVKNKKIRFWLTNISLAHQVNWADQQWTNQVVQDYLPQLQLERAAVVLPKDLYNVMCLESILEKVKPQVTWDIQYFQNVADAREWLEESSREVCYYDEGLDIEYDAQYGWIYANWKGNLDVNTVKKGCELVLDLLQAKGCSKFLNDNRHAQGNWADAADWVVRDWLPRLKKNGLVATAWILSPSSLSRTTSQKIFDQIQSQTQVQVFNDIFSAKEWLKNIQLPGQIV